MIVSRRLPFVLAIVAVAALGAALLLRERVSPSSRDSLCWHNPYCTDRAFRSAASYAQLDRAMTDAGGLFGVALAHPQYMTMLLALQLPDAHPDECASLKEFAVKIRCEYAARVTAGETIDCSKEPEEKEVLGEDGASETVTNRTFCLLQQVQAHPGPETCASYAGTPEHEQCQFLLALQLKNGALCAAVEDAELHEFCTGSTIRDPSACTSEECLRYAFTGGFVSSEVLQAFDCRFSEEALQETCTAALQGYRARAASDVSLCPDDECADYVAGKYMVEHPKASLHDAQTFCAPAAGDAAGACTALAARIIARRDHDIRVCQDGDCLRDFSGDASVADPALCEGSPLQEECNRLMLLNGAVKAKNFAACDGDSRCKKAIMTALMAGPAYDAKPCLTFEDAHDQRECVSKFFDAYARKEGNTSFCRSRGCFKEVAQASGRPLSCGALAERDSRCGSDALPVCPGDVPDAASSDVEGEGERSVREDCEDINTILAFGEAPSLAACKEVHDVKSCLDDLMTEEADFASCVPASASSASSADEFLIVCYEAVAYETNDPRGCSDETCFTNIIGYRLPTKDIASVRCEPLSALRDVWAQESLMQKCRESVSNRTAELRQDVASCTTDHCVDAVLRDVAGRKVPAWGLAGLQWTQEQKETLFRVFSPDEAVFRAESADALRESAEFKALALPQQQHILGLFAQTGDFSRVRCESIPPQYKDFFGKKSLSQYCREEKARSTQE